MTRVQHFYEQDTSTFTYLVSDPNSGLAAIVDPVLNLDYASAAPATRSADTDTALFAGQYAGRESVADRRRWQAVSEGTGQCLWWRRTGSLR